jgi:hypothetical protein
MAFADVEKFLLYTDLLGVIIHQITLYDFWTVRGSNPGWGEISRTCPDRP